jgi:hypothetical protein
MCYLHILPKCFYKVFLYFYEGKKDTENTYSNDSNDSDNSNDSNTNHYYVLK